VQVERVEVTGRRRKTEALLLEHNLIKRHRPRYNVLLKDDKSFPFIHLTAHEYPRLTFFRGTRRLPGRFFGLPQFGGDARNTPPVAETVPHPAVRDTFFANRSRPCLQYQIQRCSGPCVGLVTQERYAQDVADAVKVLERCRNTEVMEDLRRRMDAALNACSSRMRPGCATRSRC